MRIDVITLFPEMFAGVLGSSILKRAAESVADPADPDNPDKIRPPVVSYHLHNIRDHTDNKHQKVDKPPYGGGPGMVIQCQPVWDALQAAQNQSPSTIPRRIVMTPQGQRLDQPLVEQLASESHLILLAGHYEGFDQRVLDRMRDDTEHGGLTEISIGDYVLSGGEVPAMVVIDAVVRLMPGVLGDATSADHESFGAALGRGLDYPHYTRPAQWDDRPVPDILLSGDHAKIDAWRREQSQQRTAQQRPDLLPPTFPPTLPPTSPPTFPPRE